MSRFVLPTDQGYQVVSPEAIDWLEAAGDRVIVQIGATSHRVRATLRLAVQRLGAGFCQVHRGAVVNLTRVSEIRSKADGAWAVVLADGRELPLGRRYRQSLLERFTSL
jgi:two-component system LytT family response regulator